ncbi:hypothetical protein QQ008_15055 [Fulvivirgaceae bacterium BMA10]|uniref:Uncharacterized protein n=1 Tax=Splendidivirga corallicola TaxID=3051826 RepID=A0ABT8KPQ9_9BACT|nr:hypothetical protein [Fulvivirgaceae bacterium BMA10]
MSYQEKRAIVSILSSLLIFGCYSFYVFQINQEESLSRINEPGFWGSFILILIPVSIVAKIIIYILFLIINKIATNESAPSFEDERDKLIELKATRNSHYVFAIGFLLAMVTQVIDMPLYSMFIILISSGLVTEIIDEISKFYLYRRGF